MSPDIYANETAHTSADIPAEASLTIHADIYADV